jgi:hypothetical protein
MNLKKNPRAIPIPKNQIGELADRITKLIHVEVSEILQNSSSQLATKKPPPTGLLEEGKVLVQTSEIFELPFSNRDKRIYFLVIPEYLASGSYVPTAGLGTCKNTGRKIVVLDLNAQIPLSSLEKASSGDVRNSIMRKQIYRAILHEMTHVFDEFTAGSIKKQQLSSKNLETVAERAAYFNDPGEVRAFMQEIVDEVGERASTSWALYKKTFGPTEGILYLIKSSETWREISPYLSEKNQRKIILAVVKDLDEIIN